MLIMGTRAAAFTAKVRNLNDYQLRLLHGIVPLPSGVDIANTLKYFSQTLMTVLKDVPCSPLDLLKDPSKDMARMALFPSLEYKGLYRACTQLIQVATLIQYGIQPFGTSILQCLGCLLPFLDADMIDSLPYLVASALAVLPSTLHQEIINSLCYHILPFTITRRTEEEESYASMSVTSVIMLVFQHSSSVTHHCQIMECLMALKPKVVSDVLCVIAHGTSSARASAAKLLFYYWPPFNHNVFEKKTVLPKYASDWTPFVCQRDMCPHVGSAEAAKVCYDHCISITFSTDRPPPLYLCIECANDIHREHPNQMFYAILHPMQQASLQCENKHCRGQDKSAVSVCFSSECANFNGNRPIRFCQHCHSTRHNHRRGGDHLIHCSLHSVWDMSPEMQMYLLESVVSLLKEAQPRETPKEQNVQTKDLDPARVDNITLEESQQLGRYGVWLLIGLCTPRENTPPEIIGRLLSILFHWFYVTAYLYDDQVLTEGTIEKLKSEHVCAWLNTVAKNHFKVFVSCLLPHPPEYARVGGHWEFQAPRTIHLKEGLHQLLCLVPYEVVNVEIWEHIIPRWLEAIVKDVPQREVHHLKLLLSKILDPVLSPLGFDAKKMYRFLSVRFKKTTAKVQEQALTWLQMLTTLEIQVPLELLFGMFNDAVRIMQTKPEDKGNLLCPEEDHSRRSSISPIKEEDSDVATPLSDDEGPKTKTREFETDAELQLSCCILMLDLLLKQMELQGVEWHAGITTNQAQDVWSLLRAMITAQGASPHSCSKTDCSHCESRVMWYQLALELVKAMNPEYSAHPPDTPVEEVIEEGPGRKSPPDSDKKGSPKADVVLNMAMPLMEVHTVGGVLVHMPHFFSQIMTATVETVAEQLDLAPVVAQEKILPAVARQVTISDADVATAKAHIARATLVGEDDQVVSDPEEDQENFWQTSEGRFRFVIAELPAHLQLLHTLLNTLATASVSETYHALQCIHLIVLHGDAFTRAAKDDRGFFIWCQENLLIKNLWEMSSASQSHVCEVSVPLLLHCVTLPAGSDTFWNVIQEDFHSTDWKIRFHAVERVTVVARFMDSTPLVNEPVLQAALANAFCYLISSMDDEKVEVAQRATLYLGTIHDQALRALIACLESQFDSVMVDRPVVLQALYQLHNCLTDRKILSWEFFLARFDALFLEAQIALEKAGDLTFVRDLRNSDMSSESFTRRLTRAQEALSRSESSNDGSLRTIRTLTASFGPKWPYKRTMSAPATTVPHQERQAAKDKEKVYSRQYSAPMLKRKSSRFGLGQFLGCMPDMPHLLPTSGLPDGHIHSLVAGDDTGLAGLSRVLNLEGTDHETTHLLIFLLMQFLSRSDQAFPIEEKSASRVQAIVLRHLYLMLGYSQQENSFYYPPQRLRSSPVLNAFLANLPQVLDQNQVIGRVLASAAMSILQHCPAKPAPNSAAAASAGSLSLSPTHSLWLLEAHVRRSWLLAFLVLLYKYHYTQQPFCNQVIALLRIVMNTLSAQYHVCRRVPSAILMASAPSRSREMSQPSLGGERDESGSVQDRAESPPPSPLCLSEGKTRSYGAKSSGGPGTLDTHWEEPDNRPNPKSNDVDDGLWKSESTLRGSPQDVNDQDEGAERKMSLHEKMKASWFHSGDDDGQRKTEDRKCGVKQGVMMMVASSVFASTQPVTGNGVAPNPLERRSSLACAVASAMTPVVATATVVSVANKPAVTKEAKLIATSSMPVVISPASSSATAHTSSSALPSKPPAIVIKERDPSPTRKAVPTASVSTASSASTPVSAPWRIESALSCSMDDNGRDGHSYGSPESPMSKMDLITLASPIDLDSIGSRDSFSGSSMALTQLELPVPERLLQIGPTPDVSTLTERLHRSLTHDCCSIASTAEEDQSSPRPDEHSPHSTHSTHSTPSAPSHCTSKQDSLERPDVIPSRSASPRRLTKQMALAESPPEEESHHRGASEKKTLHSSSQRDRKKNERSGGKKRRKVGLFSIGSTPRTQLPRRPGSWCGSQQPLLDPATQQACHASFELRQSSFRIGEECVLQRCTECGAAREEYSDEELGLCIVTLATFIHREPGLAAPLLPEIFTTVARVAQKAGYPWQTEGGPHLPGGAVSVAHQFLRCILHQLAPNGVFVQLFHSQIQEKTKIGLFKGVAQSLIDFPELTPSSPVFMLLETLNAKKSITPESVSVVCRNMALYLELIPAETGSVPPGSPWPTLLVQMDLFFRRIVLLLPTLDDVLAPVSLMPLLLKLPGISSCKAILDPFSKILSYAIQNVVVESHVVVELCQLCGRAYSRDREKLALTRMLIIELVQALKFKTTMPDTNFITLINFVIQDTGNCLVQTGLISCSPDSFTTGTNAAEIMRQHLADALDFLADFHTVSKIKSFCQGDTNGLNEDTLGGALKSGVAQYVALEMSRGTRDNRAVARHLPWLYNAPSSLQQGPKEFLECMGHVRLLSWLLLGGLFQSLSIHAPCTPVPSEASCHVADHIQVILAGFAEQSKASVLHMSSLFHAFILCQLWTVYLEAGANSNLPGSEPHIAQNTILLDFWGKVTPCILQLVAHSKVLAEMVNLHFLSLLEALLEVNASILGRLMPLWTPVLFAHHFQAIFKSVSKIADTFRQLPQPTTPYLQNGYNACSSKWDKSSSNPQQQLNSIQFKASVLMHDSECVLLLGVRRRVS